MATGGLGDGQVLEELEKSNKALGAGEVGALEELDADDDAGDPVDTAGSTGGLEELAEAWRFLGVLSQRTTALRDISALWNE